MGVFHAYLSHLACLLSAVKFESSSDRVWRISYVDFQTIGSKLGKLYSSGDMTTP